MKEFIELLAKSPLLKITLFRWFLIFIALLFILPSLIGIAIFTFQGVIYLWTSVSTPIKDIGASQLTAAFLQICFAVNAIIILVILSVGVKGEEHKERIEEVIKGAIGNDKFGYKDSQTTHSFYLTEECKRGQKFLGVMKDLSKVFYHKQDGDEYKKLNGDIENLNINKEEIKAAFDSISKKAGGKK